MDYSKVKYVKPSVDGIGKVSGKFLFTKDKVYAVKDEVYTSGICHVTNNNGQLSLIIIDGCAHLDNAHWIPCTKDGTPL